MSGLLGIWWVWGAAALVFGILEVLAPGFVFLGFAIGAALTALVILLPLGAGWPVLLAIFAVLSLLSWIALKRMFTIPNGNKRTFTDDINDN